MIDEVISNIREAFLDEGYDEQLLQEMKHMWEAKLSSSRAVQSSDDPSTSPTSQAASATASGSTPLRLPTQPPTPRSGAQSMASSSSSRNGQYNTPSGGDHLQSAGQGQGQGHNPDVKPSMQMMDPHTRNAIQTAKKHQLAGQLDGHGVDGGSSSEEDEDDDEIGVPNDDDDADDADDKTNNDDPNDYAGEEDPKPLDSDDDLTENGSPDSNSDLFDTEHVVVCQYDKVSPLFSSGFFFNFNRNSA